MSDTTTNKVTSPYINSKLNGTVSIEPSKMNNSLYINIKDELKRQVEHKCYKNYGYLSEVYSVTKIKDGVIEAENLTSSATFDLTFSCKICNILPGSNIIAQVDRVNELLITVINGPIIVIITHENINDDVFFVDNNNFLRYKKDNTSHILKKNDFVKVIINAVTFNDGDDKIKAIGFVDRIATDDEIKQFYTDTYKKEQSGVTGKVDMLED